MLRFMSPALLRPGQKVPHSGIYRVQHRSHRAAHPVTAIRGERFPACRSCGKDVSFELLEAAEYVVEERDFRHLFLAS